MPERDRFRPHQKDNRRSIWRSESKGLNGNIPVNKKERQHRFSESEGLSVTGVAFLSTDHAMLFVIGDFRDRVFLVDKDDGRAMGLGFFGGHGAEGHDDDAVAGADEAG